MDTDIYATRKVSAKRIGVVVGALLLGLGASSGFAQQTFEGGAGNSRMNAAQVRAAGALSGMRKLRTDEAGIPSHLEANLGVLRAGGETFAADSRSLLRNLSALYRLDGTESLRLVKSNRDSRGQRHVRTRQFIDGLEVIGGDAVLHVDERSNRVNAIDSHFLSAALLPRTETVSAGAAYERALQGLGKPGTARLTAGPRLAFARTPDARGYLVWDADVEYLDANDVRHVDRVLLDARSGTEVWRIPRLYDALYREIYNFNTGALLVSEGSSTADVDAQYVYAYNGDTYNFYYSTFGRDSWDGSGTAMTSYVHGTSVGQNNAVFEGGPTYFGDGDGVTFGPFSRGRDIVGHEWTHGVTATEANLIYTGESGGLNEAMSDIFGAAIEAASTGITANTWKVGEDVYTPGTGGDALRYMNNPAQDGVSKDFYPDTNGSTDPHYSSGIANLAFYLLVNGGSHPAGKTSIVVTGIGLPQAQLIFYLALRDKLLATDGFSATRNKTAQAAGEQYGVNSTQQINLCKAWDAVGVPNDSSQCPINTVPASPYPIWSNGHCNTLNVVDWSAVPGATYYELWRTASSDFSNPMLIYSGPDIEVNVYVSTVNYAKAKACNANGCSAFTSNTLLIKKWTGPCTQ